MVMLIAVALVVIPRLTDCQSHGQELVLASGETTPMKCHWTAMAEIGVAIPMYFVGAVMTTSKRNNTRLILNILGIALGGLAIAFPTKLIGVCPNPTMICATLMKPAIIVLGIMTIGLNGLGLAFSPLVKNFFRNSITACIRLNADASKGV